jgi:hypothetical protein
MQHNPGNVALLPRPAQHPTPAHRAPFAPAVMPEAVTVCVTSAVLAPAPATAAAAAETPVFVDDSGARKRLLRIAGVLLGLLAIGFLSVVGIALATPSVATSVGLGDVTPFVVPGAAAPPPAKAPTAPQVQVAKPKPKPKPRPVQVAAPEPVAPAPQPAPSHDEPVTDPTHHDNKPHHGNHNDQTGHQSKQSDHTDGQTNQPAQTGDQGQQSTPTGQTGDQTSQTGQNQQDGQQAPAQADAPAVDANAAAQ